MAGAFLSLSITPASRFAFAPVILAAALGVFGCASIEGQQAPIDMAQTKDDNSACPTDKAIAAWKAEADPAEKLAERNRLIDECVDAIDLKYAEFVRALRGESVSINLGTDLVALGLSTAGALSGAEEAKSLSALSAGVAGAGTTIDKDLYYQKTMPALVAAMNANRNKILMRIRESEMNGGLAYTPSRARHELREYAQAGSIDAAITQVTADASASEQQSLDDLRSAYDVQILDDETAARSRKLADYIRKLAKAGDKPKLDVIATVLNIKPVPASVKDGRRLILRVLDKTVRESGVVSPKRALDEILTKLRKALPNEPLDF